MEKIKKRMNLNIFKDYLQEKIVIMVRNNNPTGPNSNIHKTIIAESLKN